MAKKHIKLPRTYNPPGKHTPPETLAYLTEAEHDFIRRMTDGRYSIGPKGVKSYVLGGATTKGTAANAAMKSASQGNVSRTTGSTGNQGSTASRAGSTSMGSNSQNTSRSAPSSSVGRSTGSTGNQGSATSGSTSSKLGSTSMGGNNQNTSRNQPSGSAFGSIANTSLGRVAQSINTGSGQIGSKGGGASTQRPGAGLGFSAASSINRPTSGLQAYTAGSNLAANRASGMSRLGQSSAFRGIQPGLSAPSAPPARSAFGPLSTPRGVYGPYDPQKSFGQEWADKTLTGRAFNAVFGPGVPTAPQPAGVGLYGPYSPDRSFSQDWGDKTLTGRAFTSVFGPRAPNPAAAFGGIQPGLSAPPARSAFGPPSTPRGVYGPYDPQKSFGQEWADKTFTGRAFNAVFGPRAPNPAAAFGGVQPGLSAPPVRGPIGQVTGGTSWTNPAGVPANVAAALAARGFNPDGTRMTQAQKMAQQYKNYQQPPGIKAPSPQVVTRLDKQSVPGTEEAPQPGLSSPMTTRGTQRIAGMKTDFLKPSVLRPAPPVNPPVNPLADFRGIVPKGPFTPQPSEVPAPQQMPPGFQFGNPITAPRGFSYNDGPYEAQGSIFGAQPTRPSMPQVLAGDPITYAGPRVGSAMPGSVQDAVASDNLSGLENIARQPSYLSSYAPQPKMQDRVAPPMPASLPFRNGVRTGSIGYGFPAFNTADPAQRQAVDRGLSETVINAALSAPAPDTPARAPVTDIRYQGRGVGDAPTSADIAGVGNETVAPAGVQNAYTVRRGDTLSKIAAKNGTTVKAIAEANGISNPNVIRPGQTLNIPTSISINPMGGDSYDALVEEMQSGDYQPPPDPVFSSSMPLLGQTPDEYMGRTEPAPWSAPVNRFPTERSNFGVLPAAPNGPGRPAPDGMGAPEPAPTREELTALLANMQAKGATPEEIAFVQSLIQES